MSIWDTLIGSKKPQTPSGLLDDMSDADLAAALEAGQVNPGTDQEAAEALVRAASGESQPQPQSQTPPASPSESSESSNSSNSIGDPFADDQPPIQASPSQPQPSPQSPPIRQEPPQQEPVSYHYPPYPYFYPPYPNPVPAPAPSAAPAQPLTMPWEVPSAWGLYYQVKGKYYSFRSYRESVAKLFKDDDATPEDIEDFIQKKLSSGKVKIVARYIEDDGNMGEEVPDELSTRLMEDRARLVTEAQQALEAAANPPAPSPIDAVLAQALARLDDDTKAVLLATLTQGIVAPPPQQQP